MKKILLISCFFALSLLGSAQTDKVITIQITEPSALTVSLVSKTEPLAFGGTDGFITLDIDGGTPKPDGSYTIQWRNSANATLTNTTNQVFGTKYRTTLNAIGQGTYTVTVIDNAYASASSTNNSGCTTFKTDTLNEPAELLVNISQTNLQKILCNGGTGSLTANPSGGVSSYQYKWYRVNGGTNTLLSPTTQTISNLSWNI